MMRQLYRNRSRLRWALVTLLALVAMVGCADQAEHSSGGHADAEATQVLEDSMGAKRVPQAAERVVALEWSFAESLLTLGAQPVGMADLSTYRDWVAAGPAPSDSVASVGGRQEPSLESVARLEPDLIIGIGYRIASVVDRYERIAPILVFEPSEPRAGLTQLEEMRRTFRTIGQAVGRSERAEQVLAELDAKIAAGREQLASLPEAERRFVLVQAGTQQNAPTMRVFNEDSMVVQLIEQLGLENAWDGPGQRYGFTTTSLEALTQVGDAHLLYVAQADDDTFEQDYRDHPVWRELAFVQAGRVHALGGDAWFFGGPKSAELLVDKVVTALSPGQSRTEARR